MANPDELSEAERRAWEGFPADCNVDFIVGDSAIDDPKRGESLGPERRVRERRVRADVLARLLCGAAPEQSGLSEVYATGLPDGLDVMARWAPIVTAAQLG